MGWIHRFIEASPMPCVTRSGAQLTVATVPSSTSNGSGAFRWRGLLQAVGKLTAATARWLNCDRSVLAAAGSVVIRAAMLFWAAVEAVLDGPGSTGSTAVTAVVLSLCAAIHNRSIRSRREDDHRFAGPDHRAMWSVTASAMLPLVWALGVLVLARLERKTSRSWPRSSSLAQWTTLASLLVAHTVATSTPLRGWLTHSSDWPETALGRLHVVVMLAALGTAYFVTHMIVIGLARLLIGGSESSSGAQNRRYPWGDRETIGLMMVTVLVGLAVATATAMSPLVTPAFVPIAICLSRLVEANRALGEDAIHDALSGLLNRRGFALLAHEALEQDTHAERPANCPLRGSGQLQAVERRTRRTRR